MNLLNGQIWLFIATMMCIASFSLLIGCNETTVNNLRQVDLVGNVSVINTTVGKQTQMDILWVVDNSGSMCQEQKVLRDNFDKFIDQIKDSSLDFHLGVTTTHAPASDSRVSIEPVAVEGNLQSTPQPVPGADLSCIVDMSNAASPYQPLRDALSGAIDCLADPNLKSQFVWSDAQIECVNDRPTEDCDKMLNIADRNGDGGIDLFDLFPKSSEYKAIPKVLKSENYRMANGTLDAAKLKSDFACMSLVGTRGGGYERGLQVAVKAVSPEWTGFTTDNAAADASKANHGFIRKDAGFTLVFVTDENDCSSPDGAIPTNNDCTADACDFYNSSAISEADSPLSPINQLSDAFKKNLALTKGRDISDGEILVASIHGSWTRFEEPVPSGQACQDLGPAGRESKVVACTTRLGKARSGDRYERFMRNFAQYYPNAESNKDPKNYDLREIGWMCAGDFSPALGAIAEFVDRLDGACVLGNILACDSESDCPKNIGSDAPGACELHPDGDKNFCESSIFLRLILESPESAQFADINTNPYCIKESIEQTSMRNPSCIIDPAKYHWAACKVGNGMTFAWQEPNAQVVQQLKGYRLQMVHNAVSTQ